MCPADGKDHDLGTGEEIMPDGSRRPVVMCTKCKAVWM